MDLRGGSAATCFSQSWVPLLLLLYFGYLVTTNLAAIGSQDDLTESVQFKLSVAVVQYGPWFLLRSYALPAPKHARPCHVGDRAVDYWRCRVLFLLSSAFELVVARFTTTMDLLIDLSMVYIAFAMIAAGLYVVLCSLD